MDLKSSHEAFHDHANIPGSTNDTVVDQNFLPKSFAERAQREAADHKQGEE